jgi:hypothetical protein
MNFKLKNIISFLFLLIFLFPLVVKLEHHHEHISNKVKSENPTSVLNEKCLVCNFEFSVFSTDIENVDLLLEKPIANYCNNYCSIYFLNNSQSSALLRAPPVFTKSI